MNLSHRILATLAVSLTVGCDRVPPESKQDAVEPAKPVSVSQPRQDAMRPARPATPDPTATPSRTVLEIPAGTSLHLTLDTTVSSKTSQVGDQVLARLSSDVVVGTQTVARAGSALVGQVTTAVPSGAVKTRARLVFSFDSLTPGNGPSQAIETRAVDITAKDSHKQDAAIIAGGAGAGGIIGAITGGKKGAGIGAIIGAGAGTGVVLVDKGNNVVLPAGSEIAIELTSPLRIRM